LPIFLYFQKHKLKQIVVYKRGNSCQPVRAGSGKMALLVHKSLIFFVLYNRFCVTHKGREMRDIVSEIIAQADRAISDADELICELHDIEIESFEEFEKKIEKELRF
jgi:hypothetical protein